MLVLRQKEILQESYTELVVEKGYKRTPVDTF